MTTSLIDYQLIKQILPNYEEYESAERAIFIIDDNFEILYTNSYTLNMLGYDLLELKEIGFRKVADIYESEFSIFYEARKDLGAHNRLRLNKKNLNLYCINATYQKVIIGFKEYFIITKYLGDLPFKVDFLASDMYFHSSDAIAIVGLDSTIQSVNHAFTRLFGFYSHEVKGKNIVKLLSPKNEKLLLKDIHKKVMMGKTENFLSRRRNKDGKVLDLEISIVPVYINSTVVSTQVIYRNLDDIIIKGQNALTFDALANNFLDGIVITNSDRIISYSNKAFNEMSGFTVDEIVGKKPDKIFRSNYHDKFYYENISKAILKKGKWQGELWNKQKDGSIKPYWLQIFSINSEDNITLRYVAIYKDLAGININKKILSMLGKDALTTIPNRTKFIEDVEEAILNFPDDQFHVAFLDINDFKVVNDEYGHSIGDKILIEFSKRLHMVFKDQIIGRYAGDEFVIFIKAPNDFKDVEMMFNKLTNLIKNIEVEGNVFNLTLSIGVATYPFDSRNIDALIDYADKAMYISKRNQLSLYKYK